MDLMAAGKFDEAGLAFEAVIDAFPDAIESWSALGVCMSELDQPDAALACQKQVIRLRGAERAGSQEQFAEQQFAELTAETGALPSLPSGRRLALATGTLSECETGGRLWSSAIALCEWMLRHPEDVTGKAILVLGCGIGAEGLFAAALGASTVTLTDGGPPALLSVARANAEEPSNAALWGAGAVEVLHYPWGEDLGGSRAYDLVLGSDVTYSMDAHEALCQSLAQQLRDRSAGCRVVLAHEHRRTEAEEVSGAADAKLANFASVAAAAGLALTTRETVRVETGRLVSLLDVCTADAPTSSGVASAAPSAALPLHCLVM